MKSERFEAGSVAFVGEQDGPPEREFKRLVEIILQRAGSVQRAYLARVQYLPSPSTLVALCLKARSRDDSMLTDIGMAFASVFGNDEQLDVLLLSEQQEKELRRVCPPFFSASWRS